MFLWEFYIKKETTFKGLHNKPPDKDLWDYWLEWAKKNIFFEFQKADLTTYTGCYRKDMIPKIWGRCDLRGQSEMRSKYWPHSNGGRKSEVNKSG